MTPAVDEREEFEKWARSLHMNPARSFSDAWGVLQYQPFIKAMFEGWEARAALSTASPQRKALAPIGYARKQDLLVYSPAWMTYATKPAPENGHEPVALYSQDQVDVLLVAALEAAVMGTTP